MQLPPVRRTGILQKRYKRFLADVLLDNGEQLTVHCPNSGSMLGCSSPGSKVVVSRSDNARRKYPWTLEMVCQDNVWIGVNTSLTNKLVREALEEGIIDEFGPVTAIRQEVRVSDKSRLDFLVQAGGREIYLEVKNCSLAEKHVAMFPDAVTSRGTRHLLELEKLHQGGNQAAVLFCVQREDACWFRPAAAIDPLYAETLYRVRQNGVKVLAYRTEISPEGVRLTTRLQVLDQVAPCGSTK